MNRYKTMLDAYKDASGKCSNWLMLNSGVVFGKTDMEFLAKAMDEALAKGKASIDFMSSKEGAIGLTEKYEFATDWLFVPQMSGDDVIRQMEETLRPLEKLPKEKQDAFINELLANVKRA